MKDIVSLLHEGHSLVVSNGVVRAFDGRGVSDLYRLLCEEADFLRGASVADKVVGKAAAALMIAGGVKEVSADLISRLALDLFEGTEIKVTYTEEVPHIVNRAGTDWCPMETRCKDCRTVEECIREIELFVKR